MVVGVGIMLLEETISKFGTSDMEVGVVTAGVGVAWGEAGTTEEKGGERGGGKEGETSSGEEEEIRGGSS